MAKNSIRADNLLRARELRKLRSSRPFLNYLDWSKQCIRAGQLILNERIETSISSLLERASVITLITAGEVYCRDILNFIFGYCDRDFFAGNLKKIYPEKLDIAEVIELHDNEIHPLELVANSLSFQSIQQIDRVFSLFLDKSLWSTILTRDYAFAERIEDISDTNILRWEESDLIKFQELFDLRHEIVHDPSGTAFFSEEVLDWMDAGISMMVGVDLVLSSVIETHKKPT